MNCKVGDIAVVIGSIAKNLGRMVVVCSAGQRYDGTPGWLVCCVGGRALGGRISPDAPIRMCGMVHFADHQLKPIRGLTLDARALLKRLIDVPPIGLSDEPEQLETLEAGVGIEPA